MATIEQCHAHVFGTPPKKETVQWTSDASALTRDDIDSVYYGTASGLPDPEWGENLDIEGLVIMTQVYALTIANVREVVS